MLKIKIISSRIRVRSIFQPHNTIYNNSLIRVFVRLIYLLVVNNSLHIVLNNRMYCTTYWRRINYLKKITPVLIVFYAKRRTFFLFQLYFLRPTRKIWMYVCFIYFRYLPLSSFPPYVNCIYTRNVCWTAQLQHINMGRRFTKLFELDDVPSSLNNTCE